MMEDNCIVANIFTTDGKRIYCSGIDFDGAISVAHRVQDSIKSNGVSTVQIFGCIISKNIISMILFTDNNSRVVVEHG